MKKSNIFLIAGMALLLIGAILSVCDVQPYANYVLIAGAFLVIIRGALRTRERDDQPGANAPTSKDTADTSATADSAASDTADTTKTDTSDK